MAQGNLIRCYEAIFVFSFLCLVACIIFLAGFVSIYSYLEAVIAFWVVLFIGLVLITIGFFMSRKRRRWRQKSKKDRNWRKYLYWDNYINIMMFSPLLKQFTLNFYSDPEKEILLILSIWHNRQNYDTSCHPMDILRLFDLLFAFIHRFNRLDHAVEVPRLRRP